MRKPETTAPVILSGAPQQILPGVAEGRGVEGSRQCFIRPCSIKAFSRELPDAPLLMHAASGSFDSPLLTFGLAQDDRRTPLRRILSIAIAALREIFDESAYDRFLSRTHCARSVVSYRAFLREREAVNVRRPRCC